MLIHIAARLLQLFAYCTVSLVKQLPAWFISSPPDKETKHWLIMPNHVSTFPVLINNQNSVLWCLAAAASPGEARSSTKSSHHKHCLLPPFPPLGGPNLRLPAQGCHFGIVASCLADQDRPINCNLIIANAWRFDSSLHPLASI